MSTIDFSVRRRDLALAMAFVLLLSAIWVARSDLADAGGTPQGVGIAVVYVAVGTNYPDALGAGPGAGLNGAPIILLPTDPPIPTATAAELERLDPRAVIIIGGTSAISTNMRNAIEALLPNADVSRIAGNDRYATNVAFSVATFPLEGWAAVGAPAFTADDPAADDVAISGDVAYNDTDGTLRATIQLPHGAEVLELVASVNAFDFGSDITIYLRRVDSTGDVSLLGSVNITGPVNNTTESSIDIELTRAIVDNENYSYMIVATGTESVTQLITVRVRYRLGTSG